MLLSTVVDGNKMHAHMVESETRCMSYSTILCFPSPGRMENTGTVSTDGDGDLLSSSKTSIEL